MNATKPFSKLADFRARLPRLANLYDRFVADSPKNFFRYFPDLFEKSEATLRFYEEIERDLSFIPASEWPAFAAKIGTTVNCYDKENRRDWEKLFDVFSEARGARVLVEKYGCDDVRLIPTTNAESCDWFGSAAGKPHYLEVKTLNHSDDERKSWHNEADLTHTCFVPAALITKAKIGYEKAKKQLNAMPSAAKAKKLVLFVVHVDHNFDPLDESVHEMLRIEFGRFEDSNYFIYLAVNTPNDF